MQSNAQFSDTQKQSMSWGQFIPSALFAFWGTGFITGFLILPLIIYKSFFADKSQIALCESIIDTTGIALQLTILLFFIFKYEPAKRLLLSSFNFRVLKGWRTYAYLLIFFSLNILFNLFVLEHVFPDALEEQTTALNLHILEQYQILLLIGSAILTPIFEELIFRGFMLRFFSERFPFWIAAILTSLFFGVAHTYSLGIMVSAFFAGLMMAILYKKTNSIIPTILFHIINNMVAFLG
ncbi:CPBP family intramembrane glutamic endopeptidase [Bacillus paramycoides]|uniref:CPBP family intramembrane glutamic endopeptidase n=1 Tax=Bacillus paramycoides TaxID=2026194 RepID=UPI002E1F5BD2|nr:CPBP family intramembrane metalloprotease [Bacillus paramycoides]